MAQVTGPSRRESVTEAERLDIIHIHLDDVPPVAIGRDMNRSESSIRTFLTSDEKHGKLFPRHGRPVPQQPALHIVDAAMNESRSRPLPVCALPAHRIYRGQNSTS
jgi:hypothetical protein